jgi:hypothetical protein
MDFHEAVNFRTSHFVVAIVDASAFAVICSKNNRENLLPGSFVPLRYVQHNHEGVNRLRLLSL